MASSEHSTVRGFLLGDLQTAEGEQLGHLLDEVREIVSSESFGLTLDQMLNESFEALESLIDNIFAPCDCSADADAHAGIGAGTTLMPMAKLVPKFMRLMPHVLVESEKNQMVTR